MAEKFWREYEGETGGYTWLWLNAFVRGSGAPYSPTPMPPAVWGPKPRGAIDVVVLMVTLPVIAGLDLAVHIDVVIETLIDGW